MDVLEAVDPLPPLRPLPAHVDQLEGEGRPAHAHLKRGLDHACARKFKRKDESFNNYTD